MTSPGLLASAGLDSDADVFFVRYPLTRKVAGFVLFDAFVVPASELDIERGYMVLPDWLIDNLPDRVDTIVIHAGERRIETDRFAWCSVGAGAAHWFDLEKMLA